MSNAKRVPPRLVLIELACRSFVFYCEKWDTRSICTINKLKMIDTSVPITYQSVGKHQMEFVRVFSVMLIIKQIKTNNRKREREQRKERERKFLQRYRLGCFSRCSISFHTKLFSELSLFELGSTNCRMYFCGLRKFVNG